MKIGTLAAQAGLNASAIRYYEKIGLLPSPARASGQRRYSSESLDRVLLIRFASEMGFSLNEIRIFLSGIRETAPVGPRWKKLATRKLIEVEQNIARSLQLKSLLRGLLHCHCPSLQFCVSCLRLSPRLRRLENARSKRR
jgi:MerR family transcriptional regulator, redox-sensitive transcriptional activator SoxR